MLLLHLLDWAIIAVSFFNTVVLLWLGFTVLLNAERRTWGTLVAGGGLLFGGLFFVIHSAVVGRNILTFEAEMEMWWRVGWLPFIGGPYLWYLVMAWYARVLHTAFHRAAAVAVSLLGIVALALLAFANPIPQFNAAVYERASGGVFTIGGVPVAILIYPAYSVLCIALALFALRRPAASDRFMGDLARQRARPWLTIASLALLLICLAVGAAAAWFLLQVQSGQLPGITLQTLAALIGFDLLVTGLIAVVAVLLGQAIVAYEVFTGKALPRRGLRRLWRRSLILAAGYGIVVGGSLAAPLPIDPIWQLMLATGLMTLFFALVSWRTYADHEQSMARLRPFVASQRLYDQVVAPAAVPADLAAPLQALCDDLLGAQRVAVTPLGPVAALVAPMAYPDAPLPAGATSSPAAAEAHVALVRQLALLGGHPLSLPVEPRAYGGAEWAIPLWSERGLIGALLIGPKRDGGLYTQEEFEIARAAGERLLDASAGAEMARRLMVLQRQRLAETQVIDRRTRRVLHDEVLPKIHEAILQLQALNVEGFGVERSPIDSASSLEEDNPPTPNAPTRNAQRPNAPTRNAQRPNAQRATPQRTIVLIATLTETHRQIADLLHAMPPAAAPEVARAGLIGALRRALADDLAGAFDGVAWDVAEETERAAERIPQLAAEVGFYAAREAARNAARHGRGGVHDRPLHLTIAASATPDSVTVTVADDGVGIGATAGMASGGAGAGLALHTTLLAVVGGALTIESTPGRFTRVLITLPCG